MKIKFHELPRPERFAFIAACLIGGGLFAIFICIFFYFVAFHRHSLGDSQDWGAFGSYVSGAAGTALSAFTLAALALTLSLQAKELAETRALAIKQSKILQEQSATMAQQTFDSVFFNLLGQFGQVRDSVKCEYGSQGTVPNLAVIVTGRDAFTYMYREYAKNMAAAATGPIRVEHIQTHFHTLYRRHESELGPYFRALYHIFKYVHNAMHLTEQQRINYANIARAQLSAIELCVVFYDGLTEYGSKFRPLIQEYGILKHVNEDKLLWPGDKSDSALYQASAFQSQEQREGQENA